MKLKYKIMNRMVEKNYTQKDLATRSKVPRSTLSNLLIGNIQSPSIKVIYRLCKALDLNMDELIKDTELDDVYKES